MGSVMEICGRTGRIKYHFSGKRTKKENSGNHKVRGLLKYLKKEKIIRKKQKIWRRPNKNRMNEILKLTRQAQQNKGEDRIKTQYT